MDAGRFTIILHLLSTMLLINCTMSYDKQQNESQINNIEDVTTEWMNKLVATTPGAIKMRDLKSLSEEDDEEHSPVPQARKMDSSGFNPVTMVFNAVTSALLKSAQNVARRSPSEVFRSSSSEDADEYYDDEDVDDNRKRDEGSLEYEKKKGSSESSIITSNTTSDGVFEGRQAGSYIKGDPLNGYYDFVITEGSYKFWVVFQLFTAGLLIYSTLAAIYYSKVNPLTSDYDYVDYLSRSFHGRSMDSTDVDDGDDENSTSGRNIEDSASTYLSSLAHNSWVRTAAYGFQFAMDAIDRIPK